jgi:hypothetical protein
MKSVPNPPPTDKAERISEESMTLIKVVIDSLTNNNQMLDLNDVMNQFKSDSYFTSDDLEKYKPVIIEYVNQKNIESEVKYTYNYCFELLIHMINLSTEY